MVAEEELRFSELIDWLELAKVSLSRIEPRLYDVNCRGIHAIHELRRNETILFMPGRVVIDFDACVQTPMGKQMLTKELKTYFGE